MLVARGHGIRNIQTADARPVNAADALSVLIAVAAGLASWLVYGRSDLSLDEGYTSAETRLPFSTLVRVMWSRELNGSLHTLLMWSLDRPAPLTMRLASLLFMVTAVVLMHRLVRRHFGPWPACAASAVLALNPAVQQDLAVARGYALSMLLIVVSLDLLDRAVQARVRMTFLLWGGVSGVMLYAHFLTGLVVAAQVLWLTVYERPQRRHWGVGVSVTAAFAIPIAVFLGGSGGHQGQLIAAQRPSFRVVVSGLLDLAGGYIRVNRLIEVGVVLLLVAVIVAGLVRRPRGAALLGFLAFALPTGALVLGAQIAPALFSERYLMISLPGLAFAVGAGVARCGEWSPWFRRVAITLLVWCNAVACAVVLTSTIRAPWAWSHPWSAAMQAVGAGSNVTTALPAEGYLARIYAVQYGAGLQSAPIRSARDFLEQSSYAARSCVSLGPVKGPLWVMSAASVEFRADVERLAACLHAVPERQGAFGSVRVALLVPVP